jgi:gamma-glutamyltranspeptidase/glutathione hydrolase
MILNLLQGVDLRAMGAGSSGHYHCVAEAIKLGCADREAFFGDPALVDVPLEGLLHLGYAEERRRLLDVNAAAPAMPAAGNPWSWEGRTGPAGMVPEPAHGPAQPDTSYVCAMDADGNTFSATPSDSGLSAPLADGLGIIISTRGSQLWTTPGHPSAIAPGKRPRLTPNPAMLVRDGRAVMPFGCPGGDAQVQAMVQVLCNILDFGMNVQAAIEFPRILSASFPGSFHPHPYEPGLLRVEGRVAPEVRARLAALGHRVELLPDFAPAAASVCAVHRGDHEVLEGGADPRRESYAIGW